MAYQVVVPPVWTNVFNCLFETPQTNLDQVLPDLAGIEKADISKSRIAIFGGKNVGKSTYTKWLINKILELLESKKDGEEAVGQSDDNNMDGSDTSKNSPPCVLYIDIDPGQAEFTPAGVISVTKITEPVHGPNFSHLSTPIVSKYLGSTSVNDCPWHYLKCISEVLEFISQEETYKNVPWILNTMGFITGLGLSLNCKAIYMLRPTIVMQILMDDDGRHNNSPFLLDPPSVCNFLNIHDRQQRHHIFDSSSNLQIDVTILAGLSYQFITFDSVIGDIVDKNTLKVKPKDLRDEVIISYFSELSSQTEDDNLLAVIPKQVSLSSIAVGTMNSSLPYNDILRAMNGNLVAFCRFSEEIFSVYNPHTTTTTSDMDQNWRLPSESLKNNTVDSSKQSEARKYLVNGKRYSNEFYGYGIVRSIDSSNSILYIITPEREEILKTRVNCIVTAGDIGLPTQLYLSGLGNSSSVGDDPDLAYVMNKRQSKSKLNEATRKQFVPKKVTHRALKNCLK